MTKSGKKFRREVNEQKAKAKAQFLIDEKNRRERLARIGVTILS